MKKEQLDVTLTVFLSGSLTTLLACGDRSGEPNGYDGSIGVWGAGTEGGDGAGGSSEGGEDASGDGDEEEEGDGGGILFDVGNGGEGNGDDGGVIFGDCDVVDGLDGVGTVETAPPDSFVPAMEWKWDAPGGTCGSYGIPLVANMTDDNGDGKIDLCDVPDIVVHSFVDVGADSYSQESSFLFLVDGATGNTHFRFEGNVQGTTERALGDIDGDGFVEVIAFRYDVTPGGGWPHHLVAFEHTGEEKWVSEPLGGWVNNDDTGSSIDNSSCVGLADVDADGDVEITLPQPHPRSRGEDRDHLG